MLTRKERMLRSINFEPVDRIPRMLAYPTATLSKYGNKLISIASKYPSDVIFWGDSYVFRPKNNIDSNNNYNYYWTEPWISIPNFNPDDFQLICSPTYQTGIFKDSWGCVWENRVEGLQGLIKKSPLAEWAQLKDYEPPDPDLYSEWGRIDWDFVKNSLNYIKDTEFVLGSGVRLWERLHFLRGYENAMMDVADNSDELLTLIEIITDYNIKYIKNWIKAGVDGISFSDDWGTQESLMISPNQWRKIFKPCYKRMFNVLRNEGRQVFFHSDGNINSIIPDLIEIGATILNLQTELNGIDNLREKCLGKVCISFQVDRQNALPFFNDSELKNYIKDISKNLSINYSGCLLECFFMPDVPIGNILAACEQTEQLVGLLKQ